MIGGRLRQRICVEKAELVENSIGEMEVVYKPYVHLWADVKPISGKELLAASAIQSEVSHRIYVRWYPGITARHRITWGYKNRRIMNIKSVINSGEGNEMLEILAFEWDSENVAKST